MTAYNRERYIAEAIESVLASTYTNFELIIVDDCSADRTVEIAKSYEEKDKRIKVYVNEKNLGDYPNRNRAVSLARGRYIMFVDSDDTIVLDGIEKCVRVMENFPDCEFGIQYKDFDSSPVSLTSEEAIHKHFFVSPFLIVGPGGTIMKRSFFLRINQYPVKYGPANDMYFNLKATSLSKVALLPFPIINYRLHDGQEINNNYSYLYNNYRYLRDAVKDLPLPLEKRQSKWISNKNKRRFTVNIMKYFLRTWNLPKTLNAVRLAEFSIKDALQGIFH